MRRRTTVNAETPRGRARTEGRRDERPRVGDGPSGPEEGVGGRDGRRRSRIARPDSVARTGSTRAREPYALVNHARHASLFEQHGKSNDNGNGNRKNDREHAGT